MLTVFGMEVDHEPRLFERSHLPLAPLLNESATGTIGSFVIVAQPEIQRAAVAINTRFMVLSLVSIFPGEMPLKRREQLATDVGSSFPVGIEIYQCTGD